MLHVRARHGTLEGGLVREGTVVLAHDRATPHLKLLELAQLPQPERRLDVGHVVLEARDQNLVEPAAALVVPLPGVAAHAVQTDHSGPGQELGLGREHPAFTSRQILGRIKAEGDGIALTADGSPLVTGGQCVGGVLDYSQAMGPGRRAQWVEVGGVTAVMHGQDRAGVRSDRRLDLARVDVERVRLDVYQYGSRAHVLDDVHGRRERHRCRDDLVPRTDTQRLERGMQGGGAGIER